MKSILSNIVFVLLSFCIVSYHPFRLPNLDLKSNKLKGNVRQVVEYGTGWGEEFIVLSNYNKEGRLTEVKIFQFNGLEISSVRELFKNQNIDELSDSIQRINKLEKSGDSLKFYLTRKFQFNYTKSGKISETKTLMDGYIKNENFSYDSSDSLIKIKEVAVIDGIKENKNTFITYKRNGDTIVQTTRENENTILEKKILKNHFNQITKEFIYPKNQLSAFDQIYEYNYDENGRIVLINRKINSFQLSDKFISNENYIYDSIGRIICFYQFDDLINSRRLHNKYFCYQDMFLNNITENWFENDTCVTISNKYYNKNEDLVGWNVEEFKFKDNKTVVKSSEKIDYQYDKKGNWIVKKSFRDSQLQENQVRDRLIFYYD